MEYYLSVGSEKRGPYSVAELAARGIGAESLVMAADGMATRLAGGSASADSPPADGCAAVSTDHGLRGKHFLRSWRKQSLGPGSK